MNITNISLNNITSTGTGLVSSFMGLSLIQQGGVLICIVALIWLIFKMFEFGIKAVFFAVLIAAISFFIKTIMVWK